MAKARLDNIDGLRGIAALAVVLGHWGEFVGHHTMDLPVGAVLHNLFLDQFSFGRLGIVTFFCISGFVVPFSFRGARPLSSFVVSRFFRLYPAYWFSMLLAVFLFPLIDGPAFTPAQVAANLTMAQRLFRQDDMLGVYWTLLIELIFYAICFGLFAAGQLHRARTNLLFMLGFLALALAGGCYRWVHPQSNLPIGVPTYLAAMHFGTLVRLAVLERDPAAQRIYPWATIALAAGALTANTLAYLYATNELLGWVAANTGYLAGLSLFLGCVHRRWFAGPTLAWLGLVSYSVYLLHPLLLQCAVPLWPALGDRRVAFALLTIMMFAGSILGAALVHRFIERPSVRMGRRVDAAMLGTKFNVGHS